MVHESGPDLKRKLVKCRLMKSERAPAPQMRIPWKFWIEEIAFRHRPVARWTVFRIRRTTFRRHHLLRQRRRNKGSGADLALEVSFGQQLSVSMKNRKTRNLDLASQLSTGRNFLSRKQVSPQDGLSVSVVDLSVQGFVFLAVDHKDRADRGMTHQGGL